MPTLRFLLVALIAAVVSGCARQSTLDVLRPIPESPTRSSVPDARGERSATRVLGFEDQIDVIATIVRDFYRPTRGQVRLVDPRALAHRRAADDTVTSDPDWSDAIAKAVALYRVCPEDDPADCAGRRGGLLRFSLPYSVTRDSATVFARYTPLDESGAQSPGLAGEIQFTMARADGNWRITNKTTVAAPGQGR